MACGWARLARLREIMGKRESEQHRHRGKGEKEPNPRLEGKIHEEECKSIILSTTPGIHSGKLRISCSQKGYDAIPRHNAVTYSIPPSPPPINSEASLASMT